MADHEFAEIYSQVPAGQKRLLEGFRANHPYKAMDVQGARWRHIACGQGDQALLFLPGGFLAADMWFHSILALEQDYRIVVPDSFTLQGTFSMDAVCRALVCSLEAEDIEKATIIGLSAGGGVAQYFVQEHPERVAHLVLSHCGLLEPDLEAQVKLGRLLKLVRLLPLFVIRRVILRATAGQVPPTSDWIEFHHAFFREAGARMDKDMVLRFLQEGLETRRSFIARPEALDSWPGEVLILSSKDDQNTVASVNKLLGRFPRARTHLFEQGGHHTFLFFPEAYTNVLKAFLDEVLVPDPQSPSS